MSDKCINKNHPSYVFVKNLTSDKNAEFTYLYYKENIPSGILVTPEQLAKKLGWKERGTTAQVNQFKDRLRKYNVANGTSHGMDVANGKPGTIKPIFRMCFVPLSVEGARVIAAYRDNVYEVDNNKEIEKAFIRQNPDFAKFVESQNKGYVVRNGEIFNPYDTVSSEDYLVPKAPDRLSESEKLKRDRLNTELQQKIEAIKNTTDSMTLLMLTSQKEGLEKQLEKVTEHVVSSGKKSISFKDVLNVADRQLAEIKDLLSKDEITPNNMLYATSVLNLWRKAGDFSSKDSEHFLLDEDEVNSDDIRKEFSLRGHEADFLEGKLQKIKEDAMVDFIKQHSHLKNISKEEMFEAMMDINKLNALTTVFGRSNDILSQSLYEAVESSNTNAQAEASEVWKNLDELTTNALKKLKSSGESNPWRFFEQKTASGKGTGRMVHRFSNEYFNTINNYRYNALYKTDPKTGKNSSKKADIQAYYKWMDENTMSFDVRKLFEDSIRDENSPMESLLFDTNSFTEQQKQDHILELKHHLGEKGYEFYYSVVENRIEKYKIARDAKWVDLNSRLNKAEAIHEFTHWNRENSPFWGAEMIEKPELRKRADGKGFYKPHGIDKYSQQIPKKTINGKTSKWYDGNFQKIENDSDLLSFYNYVLELSQEMKSFIPSDKRNMMGLTDIPKIKASVIDQYSDGGAVIGMKAMWDKLIDMTNTTDLSVHDDSAINPLTGERTKKINIQFIEDNKQKIRDLTSVKAIKFSQEKGREASSDEMKMLREEAMDEISKQYSFDLPVLMKNFSLMALSYKHKAIIEPQVKLLMNAIESRKEIVTNKAGQAKLKDGEIVSKQGNENLISQMHFYLDTQFWNIGGRKVEMVTKKKTYNTKEKAKLKELQKLLENTTSEKETELLNQEIAKLGGVVTGSALGDMALKLMTYRGLAYNVGSAFSNLGFGTISNIVEASDGRHFTNAQMSKGYLLTMNSIGKNLTFDKWEGVDKNALKIRTLMDNMDLNTDVTKELFETSNKSSIHKLGRFGPMSLQQRTEYVNNAPVMIATLLNHEATDPEGQKVSAWDALDENGKIKEGYTIKDWNQTAMTLKIRRIIQMVHGDYRNPLQVKSMILGRTLSQFRTWMFEGYLARFEKEKSDSILSYGRDTDYVRKGRYRSYTQGQLTTAGAALGTTLLPGVGTAIGAGVGFVAGKFFGMETEQSTLNDILFTLKQLGRKLSFGVVKTQFDDRFDEVDAANMRKNMTELYILMGMSAVALMITAMGGDDDEEKSATANFLLNQCTRMQTDIGFYSNPLEFEKLTKSSMPVLKLVTDASVWFKDVKNLYDDNPENDNFMSGAFKGDSKLGIHSAELIPGPAQIVKLIRSTDQVY